MKRYIYMILLLVSQCAWATVSQKQQYQIAYSGTFPVDSEEWALEIVVSDPSSGIEKLKLTSFVDRKCYLQNLGDMLFLTFDLGQYPNDISANDHIHIFITWTDGKTSKLYSAKNIYTAGKKSSENLNVFRVSKSEGLELQEVKIPALSVLSSILSLSVSDQTKCAGTTTNTIIATISNVPADFRMEEYRLDWGDNRIVTSDVSVMGGVATVRGIVKEDLKETVEGLFPRLLKNGMVLAVAEEPYKVIVKEAATVSLRAELAGKMAGDEVFFEARDDNRQENLTYRWFVNAELVAGRLDWFTSGRLQEGDVVKCGVTGDCPVESFSNEIKVYFTDVRDNNRPGMDNGGFRIPNVLTPNNDGVNDVWKLDFLQDYPDHLITIYDYAGKVVYQTRHYRNDWDGKVNEVLTYGVYTCVINLGNKKTLKTWLDVRTNNK